MRLGGSGGGVVPSGGGAKERVQKVSHITTKQTQQSPVVKVQDQCSNAGLPFMPSKKTNFSSITMAPTRDGLVQHLGVCCDAW